MAMRLCDMWLELLVATTVRSVLCQNAGAVYSAGSVLVSQSTFLGNSAEQVPTHVATLGMMEILQNGGAIAGGTGSNISTQTVKVGTFTTVACHVNFYMAVRCKQGYKWRRHCSRSCSDGIYDELSGDFIAISFQ